MGDVNKSSPEEKPPFFKSWNRLYLIVILYTFLLIAALYVMTLTLNR